jgi:NAD(P)-dependent dehydrogenase (short-subunit alcohol dehydrogenase family)
VRQAVAEHHDIEVDRLALLLPGGLPRTSSGKVRRRACRDELLQGTLRTWADRTDDWLYEITWRPHPIDATAGPTTSAPNGKNAEPGVSTSPTGLASWLILADRGGVGAALAARLADRGDGALLVSLGEAFAVVGPNHVTVDPRRPEDLSRALTMLGQRDDRPIRGLIHLWSLDLPAGTDLDDDDLQQIDLLSCGATLHLVQAATGRHTETPPRLWLVTRGAVPVQADAGPIAAAQAPLWGLGRTIVHEQPALRCSAVDLDPARTNDVNALLAEIVADDREEQIAYRSERRHVARLVRFKPNNVTKSPSIRPDATYLITGGLGALGLAVAGWLVEQGARNLALVGRRAPTLATQAMLDQLAERARVEVMAADVAQAADIADVLDRIARTMPPLRGVFHAAGLLDGGSAATLTLEKLRTVMGPKVHGTRNLHRLTTDLPLDFFVLFSSVAAVIGSPGQANYAAANAFLDAVAHDRRRAGLPALSVNWGAWAEAGMAARIADGGWALPDGIGTIAPADGLKVFERLLADGRPQVTAIPIDWARLLRFAGPAADRPLIMLGLDSLTGSVLVSRIETDLGIALPTARLVESPTITELASIVAELLPPAAIPAASRHAH